MYVSGQLLLRDVEAAFDVTDVTVCGVPEGVHAEICVQEYAVFNDGLPYPDIQKPGKSVQVPANTTQGIWLHLWVSEAAAEGKTNIACTVKTTRGDFEAQVMLRVYPVTIPEPADSAFGHEYFFCDTGYFPPKGRAWTPPVTPFYDTYRYSDEWWELMANYARAMKVLRVNSLNITPIDFLIDAGSRRVSATEWHFDYTLLDQFIELFLREGSFRYLTMCAQIAPVFGNTVTCFDEQGKIVRFEIGTPDAEQWVRSFWGGIYKHFGEKGWLSIVARK
jgi:hypothetical protein